MILYLDTSSLVKLYVAEAGSAEVAEVVASADVVATSVVALPEARSAFARLAREGTLGAGALERIRGAFLSDWDSFLKIRALKRIYHHAGELAEQYALRGFDALHLASYLEVVANAEGEAVAFSAFDGRLTTAAAAARMALGGR